MKSKTSSQDMASNISEEDEQDETPIFTEVSGSGFTAIQENTIETFDIRRQSPPSKGRYQILAWIIIVALVVFVGYLLYDNKIQEDEIISIIKRVESQTSKPKKDNILQEDEKTKEEISKSLVQGNQASTSDKVKEDPISTSSTRVYYKQVKLSDYPPGQIPKRSWYYHSKNLQKSSLWTQRCFQRYKSLSSQLKSELITVNISNYGQYIPRDRFDIVQEIIQNLNTRYEQRAQPEIIRYRDLIVKQLITLEVVIENGGIFVDEDIILTEDLSWIYDIGKNKLVNAGQWINKAQIVAFYSTDLSDQMIKADNIDADLETDRYITLFPTISPYFLAAVKNNRFLLDLRDQYHQIVLSPRQVREHMSKWQIKMNTNNLNIYKYFFEIASQFALRKQQNSLQNKEEVIKFYQIAAINQNFGPTKIKSFLSSQPINKIMSHLSFISRDELEFQFGKIQFMLRCEPQDDYYVELHDRIKSKNITNNSLIHSLLFESSNQSFITVVKEPKSSSEKWNSLPAKAWTYLTKRSEEYSLIEQMWLEHTKVVCKQSNFTFTILNEDNIHQFITNETINRITHSIDSKRSKLVVYPTTRMQLLSLAVIYEQGGVWIDPLLFLTDNFEWLRSINREKYLWNKNGKLPKVVLAFHPHYGSPFEWVYTEEGVKDTWHLSYENGFIAAQSKSQLIKTWLDEFLSNLGIPYNDLLTKFYLCKMLKHKWIGNYNHQFLAQDSIKCALGAKKFELSSEGNSISPNDYFGLWGLNGFSGFLKMREYTHFFGGRNMENPFMWRYSFDFMQEQVGKVHHISKIYTYSIHKIQNIFQSNLKDFSKEIHKDSFIMRVLNKIKGNVVKRDNRLYLLSEYNKMKNISAQPEGVQLLSNITKVLWVYQGGEISINEAFNKNMFSNFEHYAKESKYEVRYVSRRDYNKWLSLQSNEEIKQFLSELQQKLSQQKSNLKDHYENVVAQMICLSLLYENGGIVIDKKLILHQNLNWISEIERQQFINMKEKAPAKVFAFHSLGYSPAKVKDPKSSIQYVKFPSIQHYFIAAGKRSVFIKDLKQNFQTIVLSHPNIVNQIKKLGHETGWLHGNDPYFQAFFIASQFTLSHKQQQLTKLNIQHSALEEYGLYTMNSRFFAAKLSNFISSLQVSNENLYQYLARTPVAQLESYIGKLRYLSLLPRFNELKDYVVRSSKGDKGFQIVEKSFLHQYLVLDSQKKGIIKYPASNDKGGSSWTDLPQDVWVYTDKEINPTDTISKVMLLHINTSFSSKGYKVHDINEANMDKFLNKDVLREWKKIIGQKNNQVHKQYIYRLLLLLEHGGISLSMNLIPTEDVSWIKEISHFHRELIFNRFEEKPQILMFVDQLRSAGTHWEYSSNDKTRMGHKLGWNDDFVAVEKGNDLIKEWVETLKSIISLQPKQQLKMFQECGLKESRMSKSYPNKLRLDVLQCILNRKYQKIQTSGIKTEVCKYYHLWGISEHIGLAKFQDQFNLDKTQNDLNPLIWKWPQSEAETLIGKVQLMTRLSSKQLFLVEGLVKQKKEKPWGEQNSLIVKTLYSSAKGKIKANGDSVLIV